jgi:fibro-slime domain-containing protein
MRTLFFSIGSILLAASCSSDQAAQAPHGAGGTGSGGTGGLVLDTDAGVDGPPTPGCADGILTPDEACDDHNLNSGDGCAGNCRSLERGWSCPTPGQACIRIARCGDGFAAFPELCDDGNTTAGDGCSATCKVEVGYKCAGEPSVCTPTTCGDGVQEGAESCEDTNVLPFDGCSTLCQAEPDCSAGACTSRCGDGLVLGEACDDGNNNDGDGCSATCTLEPGYDCVVPQPSGNMVVPAVFRDFLASHPDFEIDPGPLDTPTQGMLAPTLDADGKPVWVSGGNVTSAQTFAEWYRDVPGTNSTTVGTLTLWDTGAGSYVNRYGANGEKYQALDSTSCYCGTTDQPDHDATGAVIPCTSCYYDNNTATPQCDPPVTNDCSPGGRCAGYIECIVQGNTYHGVISSGEWDGNPLFFPVDGDPFTPASERFSAKIPPSYGSDWGDEPGTPLHNFHFTSEVRYWFQFNATETYVLDFTGDDDVWVFINNRLVVDVGGIHSPVNAHLTLDGSGTASVTYAPTVGTGAIAPQTISLGLQDGSVYEIAVFQAERHVTLSSFKLTLDGFATARSECAPICGDGIVGLGEECDDGVNDGGYGECGPGCTLGSFCGDGVIDEGEECDDGNNLDGDLCGSACRNILLY